MNARERVEYARLDNRLDAAGRAGVAMLGIAGQAARDCLIRQMIDSQRRERYMTILGNRGGSGGTLDPIDGRFDPQKAAAQASIDGNHDEACWLLFLSRGRGNLR